MHHGGRHANLPSGAIPAQRDGDGCGGDVQPAGDDDAGLDPRGVKEGAGERRGLQEWQRQRQPTRAASASLHHIRLSTADSPRVARHHAQRRLAGADGHRLVFPTARDASLASPAPAVFFVGARRARRAAAPPAGALEVVLGHGLRAGAVHAPAGHGAAARAPAGGAALRHLRLPGPHRQRVPGAHEPALLRRALGDARAGVARGAARGPERHGVGVAARGTVPARRRERRRLREQRPASAEAELARDAVAAGPGLLPQVPHRPLRAAHAHQGVDGPRPRVLRRHRQVRAPGPRRLQGLLLPRLAATSEPVRAPHAEPAARPPRVRVVNNLVLLFFREPTPAESRIPNCALGISSFYVLTTDHLANLYPAEAEAEAGGAGCWYVSIVGLGVEYWVLSSRVDGDEGNMAE